MNIFCLAALYGIAFSSAALAEPRQSVFERVMARGEINCGYFTWAPYVVKDPNTGALSGINYEFMEAIGKHLGLRINWTDDVSAATAIEGLNTGRYDVMCASLWPDRFRLANALMSAPEFYDTVYAVARTGDHRFDGGLDSLNSPDVTLAGIDGDVTYTLAKDAFPLAKVLALPQMSTSGDLLMALATRKADVIILDKGTVADFNKTNKDTVRVIGGVPPVKIYEERLVVKKGEDQLLEMLNRAILQLQKSGEAAHILEGYKKYGYALTPEGTRQ